MTETTPTLPTIDDLIRAGALFVANHSGGKDSQAMLIKLLERVPARQLLVVHASLGEAEWELVHDSLLPVPVRSQAGPHRTRGAPLRQGERLHQHRELLGDSRPREPRACQAPQFLAERARQHRRTQLVRMAAHPRRLDGRGLLDHRRRRAGAALGLCRRQRTSQLRVLIMGSPRDLANGAKHRPELLAKYIEIEQRTGYTMHQSRKPLRELVSRGEAQLREPKVASA